MKKMTAMAAVVLLLGVAPRVAAEKPASDPAALERQLYGTWTGTGPCDGGLTIRPDGTYERKLHGFGGNNSDGTWEVRWDSLPPTLVLICKTSDDPVYVGKQDVKLIQLDDQYLAFKYPSGQTTPVRYSRAKK